MSPARTSGGYANAAGHTLENVVRDVLQGKGFVVVSWAHFIKQPDPWGPEVLLTNVPYTTIYGHEGRTEFVLRSAHYALDVRIECKWQQSAGSVDEKFPYLYLNCIQAMPESTIFILLDGGGAKPRAVTWLREAASTRLFLPADSPKQVHVFSLQEFLAWVNRTLR